MTKQLVVAIIAFVSGLLPTSYAAAQCGDTWALQEIYSNADGSVQFLVMTSAAGGDATSLTGTMLVASNGATEHAYTFPGDVRNRQNGHFILVGSQGYADLDLVKPDFVVPNGFLFLQNGSVRLSATPWCGGPVQYTTLPTDGVNAYWPDAFGDGFPLNGVAIAGDFDTGFGRGSYTFTANFGGLWWNSPAGSESGWGIALEHQRDIVFAAWATYDTDGSPTWFVMPTAGKTGTGPGNVEPITFGGVIYRATGASSDLPFDSSAVKLTKVGVGEFQFSSTGDSTFSYTIGDADSIKKITRQVFADPVPLCQIVAMPGPLPNYQGFWWDPAEAGWGLYLAHQGNVVFVVWFTYDANGKPTWLAMTATPAAPNTYTGAIYRTTGPAYSASAFDSSKATGAPVGTGTLTFADRGNGSFSYTLNTVAQTKIINRQIFADPPAVCN